MRQDTYHFIGLGGIGMSGLARILLQRGAKVQGSDATQSPLLDELRKEGAQVQIGHDAGQVDGASFVIYTSAVKEENVELRRAKELGVPLLHRSDLLDHLMQGKRPLLVTGVHGKTTTTSLLASVLLQGGLDPSFIVGGIHRESNTNGRSGNGSFFVAESDESDGSFLKTPYYGAIVTNLEDEHLDYWKTSDALDRGFAEFFALGSDLVFWCGDDERLRRLKPQGISYGFGAHNQLRVDAFRSDEKGIAFDLHWEGKWYPNIQVSLAGKHNALNAAAVFGKGLKIGIDEANIRKAFREFQGAARRLEWKGRCFGIDVFDDYGHHPTEIQVTLKALRERMRERRIVAIFQPHRYTRVRDCGAQFIESFGDADMVIMTEIYSAGEAPIEGITTAALYAKMREKLGSRLHFYPRSQLEAGAAALLQPHDAVITLGAGDITRVGGPLLALLAERAPKLKVGVAFGGKSAEHPVSLISAKTILNAMDRELHEVIQFGVTREGEWLTGDGTLEKLEQGVTLAPGSLKLTSEIVERLTQCDVVIPVFHGPRGEDGMIQGLLDALHVPYASCDYRSSSLSMHKGWTKKIAIQEGIPTAPFVTLKKNEKPELPFPYPVWVKPVHLGSSFGVSRAASEEEIQKALDFAFSFDDEVLVEREIVGKQIEFGIYGNEFLQISACEILNEGSFCGYNQKYGAGAYPYAVPPRIPPIDLELGKELALAMYQAAGCKVLARIDFFYDGHYWLNEINPFPGCTPTSAFPEMWEKSGVSMKQICNWLVILALHKDRRCLA